MERIKKITSGGKEVWIIDYSNCKEQEMISLVTELKEQITKNNKPALILAIFNDQCYVTSKFMRHAEQVTRETIHLIEKQAFVGLNTTKKMILKGYNFTFKKNIQSFDTREAAQEFLLDEKTTNSSDFWK